MRAWRASACGAWVATMALDDLAEVFRLAFLRGAQCEAECRGGSAALTTAEDAEEAWQESVRQATADPAPEPPP
jgi:hypothetical protein